MVGDLEKLLNKGDNLSMNVLGKPYVVKVMDTDVSEYERRYVKKRKKVGILCV